MGYAGAVVKGVGVHEERVRKREVYESQQQRGCYNADGGAFHVAKLVIYGVKSNLKGPLSVIMVHNLKNTSIMTQKQKSAEEAAKIAAEAAKVSATAAGVAAKEEIASIKEDAQAKETADIEAAQEAGADMSAKINSLKDQATDKFNDLKDKATDKLGDLKDKASAFTAQALDKSGDLLDTLSDKVHAAADKLGK